MDDQADAHSESDILDLVDESVFRRDLSGRVISWNLASECLYGWRKDQALGQIANELLRTQPSPEVGAWETSLGKKDSWNGELERTTADGKQIVVDVTWRLRRGASGEPIEIVETGRDATPTQIIKASLRWTEQRYTNLFNAMAVSFWELDFSKTREIMKTLRTSGVTDFGAYFKEHREFVRELVRATRVVDVNEQTVSLFGHGRRKKEDLLTTLEYFWPEPSLDIFAACVAASSTKSSHYFAETRFRDLDGHEFDALFTASFPPEMMAQARMVIGIIDISAAKQARLALEGSERQYRHLFQFVPVPLVRLDRTELAGVFATLAASGVRDLAAHIDAHPEFTRYAMDSIKIVETNHQAVQLFGARDPSEILGPVTRLWSESPEVFVRSMRARFDGALRFESEIKIKTFDGRVRRILYVTDFPEAFNNPAFGLACLFDITDRVEAQEKLHRVQSDFAHAARISMLGELTASIAHEVNQPLASISAAGEASLRWLDRPRPELSESRDLIARMIGDAQRAADIIARVRSMATPAPPDHEPLTLGQVIREVLSFLHHEIQKHGVRTELKFRSETATVNADRIQLQQVIANLVINAIQAMSGPNIDRRILTIRIMLIEVENVLVEVEDSGTGILPEKTESLFESFYTTKPGGLGIGLPISRSIIEAHGGTLTATNRPDGPGAVFRFTLPLHFSGAKPSLEASRTLIGNRTVKPYGFRGS